MSRRNQTVLCACLIAANLAFIWGNSAVPAQGSDGMSDQLLRLLFFLPQNELGSTILRKAAHFSEFACLGILMGWMMVLRKGRISPGLWGLGLACACIDETIQYFVPGRSSSVLDVWLDSAGTAAGLALMILGYTILNRKHNFGGK